MKDTGCAIAFIVFWLIILLGFFVQCTGIDFTDSNDSRNPYTPGTTNYERLERLYGND